MGAVGFTGAKARDHEPRLALSGRGKLHCGMGSIRQKRNQSGGLRVLLS